MLRENLKAAIAKSGMIVKEIAVKSGVNKRTIDKWVGVSKTEPKVNDLYKVCKVLSVTMEWLVDGEAGAEYMRKIVRNDPKAIQVPDRISPIVEGLLFLDDKELNAIRASVEVLSEVKKGTPARIIGQEATGTDG
jgi:transcriptional regulator with XRE-family HTH domain